MTYLKRFLVVLFAFALTACAAKYESIPFNQQAAKPVQRIALVTPSMPDEPTAWLATTVGQSFGLIGAIIDAGMQANRNDSLEQLLSAESFNANQAIVADLKAALEERGYEVVEVNRPAATDGKREFLKSYPNVSGEPVDAYLDVIVVGYGYGAAGITSGSPYRPIIYTQNRLVSADGNTVLMKDDVLYNPIGGSTRSERITISPAPEYSFSDFDAIETAPEKAVNGLRTAFNKTAVTIGTLLQ